MPPAAAPTPAPMAAPLPPPKIAPMPAPVAAPMPVPTAALLPCCEAQPATNAPATAITDKRVIIFEFISFLQDSFEAAARLARKFPVGSSGVPLRLPLQYGQGFKRLKRCVPRPWQRGIVQRTRPPRNVVQQFLSNFI